MKTLYCYKNDKLTEIRRDVLDVRTSYNTILFNTRDQLEPISIQELFSPGDVTDRLRIDNAAANYVLTTDDSKIVQLSENAAEDFDYESEKEYTYLFEVSTEIYMSAGEDGLFVATVSDGRIGGFQPVLTEADSIQLLSVEENDFYYFSDSYENNGNYYCSLYCYQNGKETRLAQDIISDQVAIYDDGVILAYTGSRAGSGYELTMFDTKGTPTAISEDVTRFIRVDGDTLLFIADDDLYVYGKKGKTMVKSDVDMVWSRKQMAQKNLGWYGGYYGGYYGVGY